MAQLRFGISNLRNPALASHAFQLLPYRGLGSGIPRATVAWPKIDLLDDRQRSQFTARVQRPELREEDIVRQPESRPESRPESQPESVPQTEGEPESGSELLTDRIVAILKIGPMSKTEISTALGQRTVSGPLNKAIRTLLAQGRIAMTLPATPQSRLQKYRLLTAKP